MSDLAERMRITRSRLSHALSALEKRGWVRRRVDPADKRGQFAVLTDEGTAAVDAAAPGHVAAVQSAIFDHLSADQVEQFAAVSETIIATLIGKDGYPAELPWRRR
jgi:DNA-binding MarR family transcriptional regulator